MRRLERLAERQMSLEAQLIHEKKGKRARDLGFASVVLTSCDMEQHDVRGQAHLDCRRGPGLELLWGYLQTLNLNMGFMGLFRCYKPSLLPAAACPHLHLLGRRWAAITEYLDFRRTASTAISLPGLARSSQGLHETVPAEGPGSMPTKCQSAERKAAQSQPQRSWGCRDDVEWSWYTLWYQTLRFAWQC